jgi:hypothetical protein
MHSVVCCTIKKITNNHRTQQRFINYYYSYIFPPRGVIIRVALGHFEANVQIALLEMKSHYLHNAFNVSVCVYVRTYVCIYVCMYVGTYVCVCMYICMYVGTYVCMYVYMYVCRYMCVYVCIYVRTCVCLYVYMYVYMYIRIYVCMCPMTFTDTFSIFWLCPSSDLF